MLADFAHRHRLKKSEFKAMLPDLRAELLETQNALRQVDFPVIVLFAGVDGAGKSEVVNLLNEWMDPRFLVNRAYVKLSESQIDRPEYWRYWRDMPPKGQIGLFLSAWYSPVLLDMVEQAEPIENFARRIQRIQRFEKTLAEDGALIVKYWMHLDKRRQKKQLTKLQENPATAWRVTTTDWAHWAMYERFVTAGDTLIAETDTNLAPWQVIDGADPHYRSITVAEHLLNAIRQRLSTQAKPPERELSVTSPTSWLGRVDMQQTLEKNEYRAQLEDYQGELNRLCRHAQQKKISSLLVFEGWDAAGKGGAIRRIIHALDPRSYRVIPIAAPTDEERAQHYLWRFWRHLPRPGHISIFDRSWYGRVLVERVEGFAQPHEWQRAYDEINEFEQELVEQGILICKFWLHISQDEQLRRFEERRSTPHKAWKLTEEDWRNREKWAEYEEAVDDMAYRTSPKDVPWVIVPANDKYTARIRVLQTICERLAQCLAR